MISLILFALSQISFYAIKHLLFPIPLQDEYPEEILQQAYPNLSPDEIKSFLHEWATGQEWGADGEKSVTYEPYAYYKTRDRAS